MSLTCDQILEAARKARELIEDPSAPAVHFLPAEQAPEALPMANAFFGDNAIRALGVNVGVVVDDHGHFVALMDRETYDAMTKIPAGAFKPRVYEPWSMPVIRKHQPPYWAHDWRRGRKGKGR